MVGIVFPRYIASVSAVSSGSKYGEIVFDATTNSGVDSHVLTGIIGQADPVGPRTWIAMSNAQKIWYNGAGFAVPDHLDSFSFSAGDVAMFAIIVATRKVWVGKVGSGWYNGGNPATITGQTATLSSGTDFYLCAGIERDDAIPIAGPKFSLRTQSSQFTGTIPSGFAPWYP
jgi:hypothetical protein